MLLVCTVGLIFLCITAKSFAIFFFKLKTFYRILILISSALALIITYIRIVLPIYEHQLENVNHIIAGITMPLIILCSIFTSDKVYKRFNVLNRHENIASGILYIIISFIWEFFEFFYRGFLQYDQYLCDLIGVCIFLLLQYIMDGKNKQFYYHARK